MAKKALTWREFCIGYANLAAVVISQGIATMAVQALQGAVPDFELSTMRALAQVLSYLLMVMLKGSSLFVSRERLPKLIYLGLLYVVYNVGHYGACAFLPLVDVSGIFYPVLMIAAILHAKLVFHKDILKLQIVSVPVCVLGIMLILQPSLIFGDHTINAGAPHNEGYACSDVDIITNTNSSPKPCWKENTTDHTSVAIFNNAHKSIGYALATIGGVATGMSFDVNAVLLFDLDPLVKAVYVSGSCTVASGVISLYMEDFIMSLSPYQWLCVFGHCSASVVNTACTIYAAHLLGGVRISFTLCLQVLLSLVTQHTIMQSIMPGYGNWAEVIGAVIIVIGVALSPAEELIRKYKNADALL